MVIANGLMNTRQFSRVVGAATASNSGSTTRRCVVNREVVNSIFGDVSVRIDPLVSLRFAVMTSDRR